MRQAYLTKATWLKPIEEKKTLLNEISNNNSFIFIFTPNGMHVMFTSVTWNVK